MSVLVRNNKLADLWIFEALTRPEVTPGFFPNKRVGEHINITVGKSYRERVKLPDGKRKFIKGR